VRRRLSLLLALALAAGAAVDQGAGRVAAAPARALDGATPPAAASPATAPCPVPEALRPAFERAAADATLPLALLVAVGEIESNLDPDAVSHAGARGVLQVLPTTGRELELDVDHVPSNLLAGARYLRRMLDLFRSTQLALAAYNAGPTAVAAAGGAPGPETRAYVAAVTSRWRELVGCR
jgi:soluble lytic murein transglycosylase-like protein